MEGLSTSCFKKGMQDNLTKGSGTLTTCLTGDLK